MHFIGILYATLIQFITGFALLSRSTALGNCSQVPLESHEYPVGPNEIAVAQNRCNTLKCSGLDFFSARCKVKSMRLSICDHSLSLADVGYGGSLA